MEAKATLEKLEATLKCNGDTHNINCYRTMSNIINEDQQYGWRFHV